MYRLFQLFSFFLISTLLFACNGNSANPSSVLKDTIPSSQNNFDASIPGNFSSQTQLHFDSSAIEIFLKKYDSLKSYNSELKSFYQNRKYAHAWFDKDGLIEQSNALYTRIQHLEDEGVSQNMPYRNQYLKMMEGADTSTSPKNANTETELMITSQYLSYAHRVWSGIPETASKKMEWFVPRKKMNYSQFLDSLLNSSQNGKALQEPVYRQYRLLKNYLKRFREIEKKGTWFTIKTDKNKYREKDSSDVIKDFRKKLFLAGDLSTDSGSPVFDSEMTIAVKKYQQRYGLKEDGIIGPAIIREMNAPLNKRIQQIIVNMERSRWVDSDPTGDYLVVNIPQFKLLVYEHDSLVWTSNVVVGKEAHKTAIFQGEINNIVFSPYWNVPPGIQKNEILPAIKRNPNYLAQHNMEWNGNQVRQKPGPGNALGKVKFLFPNSFSMYLHDTPSKSLFQEDKRAFSHGCIRVSEPAKLAAYLLREDSQWTKEKIDQAMNAGKEQWVKLKNPTPVSIVYFTAWVDREGRINFREDIYNRDSRLMEAIFAKK